MFACGNNDDYGYYGAAKATPPPGPFGQGVSFEGGAAAPVVPNNLRFRGLASGVSFAGNAAYKVYDCQFAGCGNALVQTGPNATIGL